MKLPVPHVTDHAVLRYLERAHGVPVEAVRTLLAAQVALGAARDETVIPLGRVKIVLENGVAVTVLKRRWRTKEELQRAQAGRKP